MEDLLSNHPLFRTMDPEKLAFIQSFIQAEKPSQIKDAMPFLLANMNMAKKKNIHFSNPEIQLIAEILSQNLSPADKNKVNRIMSMMLH